LYKFFKLLLPIFCTIFIALVIRFPEQSYEAAKKGLNLWFTIVVPSLLPFFVGSSLLIHLGVVDFLGILMEPIVKPLFRCPGIAAYIFVMSITSGYPMGPKLTSQLRMENKISSSQAQRILSFANTSGPLFMIGAVAVGMLNNPKMGTIICISHYCAAILTGTLFRHYGDAEEAHKKSEASKRENAFIQAFSNLYNNQLKRELKLGELLGDAVRDSVHALLTVGGFIIFFSVIIHILLEVGMIQILSVLLYPILSLLHVPTEMANGFVSGFFEITTGCMTASQVQTSIFHKVSAVSAIISWGGLSVHAQALSLLSKANIRPSLYLLSKGIQAILSYIITTILLVFFYRVADPVFGETPRILLATWPSILFTSSALYLSSLLVLFAMGILAWISSKIRIIR
jgi:sporulation integral membrane protein YlbJ